MVDSAYLRQLRCKSYVHVYQTLAEDVVRWLRTREISKSGRCKQLVRLRVDGLGRLWSRTFGGVEAWARDYVSCALPRASHLSPTTTNILLPIFRLRFINRVTSPQARAILDSPA
jgi:hypothetical protein